MWGWGGYEHVVNLGHNGINWGRSPSWKRAFWESLDKSDAHP